MNWETRTLEGSSLSFEITNKYNWYSIVESEIETGMKFLKDQEGIEGTARWITAVRSAQAWSDDVFNGGSGEQMRKRTYSTSRPSGVKR